MTLKLFPWDNGGKPDFINDKGFEWYVNDSMTRWCSHPTAGDLPPLRAVCFYVAERVDGKVNPITMVLIDRDTNEVLYENSRIEDMAVYIDMLRFVNKEP